MFFKEDENKITDFIEKNEENISKKESKQDKLVISASDIVDETANTIVMQKSLEQNEEINQKQDIAAKAYDSLSDEIKDISENKDEIDKKIKEFYQDYTAPKTSHKEYNTSGLKETAPSYVNDKQVNSDIYIRNNMYAGFWSRSFAYLIDIIMVYGIKNILEYVNLMPQDIVLKEMMLYIIFVVYNFILVYLTNGYTIGKIIMNIKVVCARNENINFLTAFIREFIGKYILIRFPIIFLFLIFSPKKHHLVDYLSDTDVIKERYEEYFRATQKKQFNI